MATPVGRADYLQLARKHVQAAHLWGVMAGTDFWMMPSANGQDTSGNAHELSDYGWTTTSLVPTAGSGADLITSADKGVPGHTLTNASGDILGSPALFGDYYHALQAARIAGMGNNLPRLLVAEFVASFSVASADENQSAIGFFEDGATISTQADQLAVIYSNGVNFKLISGADSTGSTGAAIDTSWHLWKIELNVAEQVAKWYIDGTYQGSIAIETDEFPCKFGMHALTTNRPLLGWVHVYYEW